MGKRRRYPGVNVHVPGEAEPCEECREELGLLSRAQELQDQEGLQRRELVDALAQSLKGEAELERMYELPAGRRRGK